MSDAARQPLKRVVHATAEAACGTCELSDEALPLRRPEMTPEQYLDALQEAGLLMDAARFLAFALPPREAIWWACQVARLADGESKEPLHAEIRTLAEKWVRTPDDDAGRQLHELARREGLKTASAWAGLATYFAGTSLGPAGGTPVPPPPDLVGNACATAVVLAALNPDAEGHVGRLVTYLAMGRDIGAGGRGRA